MTIYPSYVYRLDHPTSGEFYIGFRAANKVPAALDLGIKYFTSSKVVKPRFHEFEYQVIAEFFDADAAYAFEQQLIFESWGTAGLLNKSHRHGKSAMNTVGIKMSAEQKAKVSAVHKGKKLSLEHKAALAAVHKGMKISAETRAKMSASMKGKKRAIITCPHCAKAGGANNMIRFHFDKCKYYFLSPTATPTPAISPPNPIPNSCGDHVCT